MSDDIPLEPDDGARPFGATVIDLGEVRIAWGRTKPRAGKACEHRTLVYSTEDKRVWCEDCKRTVENWDALMMIVKYFRTMEDAARSKNAKADEALKSTARLRATKALDKAWSGNVRPCVAKAGRVLTALCAGVVAVSTCNEVKADHRVIALGNVPTNIGTIHDVDTGSPRGIMRFLENSPVCHLPGNRYSPWCLVHQLTYKGVRNFPVSTNFNLCRGTDRPEILINPNRIGSSYLAGCSNSYAVGWCRAKVFKDQIQNNISVIGFALPKHQMRALEVDVRSEFFFGGHLSVVDRSLRRVVGSSSLQESASSEPEGASHNDRAHERQPELGPCRRFLPFTSVSAAYRSRGGILLGLQIGSIMLVGFSLAFLGMFYIVGILEVPDRNRKFLRGFAGVACLAGTVSFYSWAFLGNPGVAWGLCKWSADQSK